MYKKILLNKCLPISTRIKRFLEYYSFRRGAKIGWEIRLKKLFKHNPEYCQPLDRQLEKEHISYWSPFLKHINLATIRISVHISGQANPKIIPEEIFVSDIEPTLNNNPKVDYLSYKSIYNRWFPGSVFPECYFHNIQGEWLDKELNRTSFSAIESIARNLNYPVVIKPNKDSYGGANIYFPENHMELFNVTKGMKDFLVQEKIQQHSFFNQFNSFGLNTLRVYVYRSVSDNKHYVINMVLRMGLNGSLDNETAGGIVTLIKTDGTMNGFAVDKYGKKYFRHPDNGVEFNKKIPELDKLKELSIQIAQKIFYARLVGLDICYDNKSQWRVIEINTSSATIRFAQYHGELFFGQFSEEVFNYCLKNHWTYRK